MPTVSSNRVSTFDRIVCAVDGSSGSREAVAEAEALRHGVGTIELVGVVQAPDDGVFVLWSAADRPGGRENICRALRNGSIGSSTRSDRGSPGAGRPGDSRTAQRVPRHPCGRRCHRTQPTRGNFPGQRAHRVAPPRPVFGARGQTRMDSLLVPRLDRGGLRRVFWSDGGSVGRTLSRHPI